MRLMVCQASILALSRTRSADRIDENESTVVWAIGSKRRCRLTSPIEVAWRSSSSNRVLITVSFKECRTVQALIGRSGSSCHRSRALAKTSSGSSRRTSLRASAVFRGGQSLSASASSGSSVNSGWSPWTLWRRQRLGKARAEPRSLYRSLHRESAIEPMAPPLVAPSLDDRARIRDARPADDSRPGHAHLRNGVDGTGQVSSPTFAQCAGN